MQNAQPITAKAADTGDQSDAIVVSFGAEWHQPLCERKFKAVIRKRIPKTLNPAWLYFHVNAPVSAICARAPILALCDLKRDEALRRAADLALSPADITTYIGGDPTIGCYELGTITPARGDV